MRRTTYPEPAHTADTAQLPADSAPAHNGLPNRLMTAFEVADAKLSWDVVQDIRRRAQADVTQSELAGAFHIPQSLCSEIITGQIWDPDAKLTTGDEMRDRIIGALDTGCRCGEMMKVQNKHVDRLATQSDGDNVQAG